MTDGDTFLLCHDKTESLAHAFRDCTWMKRIWIHFKFTTNILFYQQDMSSWMKTNIQSNKRLENIQWSAAFGGDRMRSSSEILGTTQMKFCLKPEHY